jgi:predicted transcriptional regulator
MKKKGNKVYEANIVSDSDDVLKIAKALDSEIRIRIIKELLRKNYTMRDVAKLSGKSISSVQRVKKLVCI